MCNMVSVSLSRELVLQDFPCFLPLFKLAAWLITVTVTVTFILHVQPFFSALNCSKIFHDKKLVPLKDCLIIGFQENMASTPVQFVRILCEHISALQQTIAF